MIEIQDPNEDRNFFNRSPKFWDKLVKCLFISGLSIVFFALVLKWLGYFG